MRILVYGAGAIGSFNAARLAAGGHDVALLARGDRLDELRQHGIVLQSAFGGPRTTTRVRLVESLGPDDAYDLVLVALRRHQTPAILAVLAANRHTPSVLFIGNNAAGADEYVAALGHERVLLGQGNLGGVRDGPVVRYLWARFLPLEIGELDGRRSARTDAIVAAFGAAGLPVQVVPDIDARLRTHAASLVPIVAALYRAGGDVHRLARSRATLRAWVRATREAQVALRRTGVPTVPGAVRLVEAVPDVLTAFFLGRLLDTRFAEIGLADALVPGAAGEMKELADEQRAMLRRSGARHATADRLYPFIDARAAQEALP
jgi:2-dehydropantoate 2-reductase